MTVIKDAAGRYFASFVVETADEPLLDSPNEIGIDLGLTHFAVTSDGRKIANPRILRRAAKKLRKAQQALSRKEKGSANRAKARLKVAKAHAQVAGTRRDFAHKLSTQIIRDNQAVYVEDLAVKGMARTKLAKSVHDAGWSQFVNMLEYKAKRYGRTFAKIDRSDVVGKTLHEFKTECQDLLGWYDDAHLYCYAKVQQKGTIQVIDFKGQFIRKLADTDDYPRLTLTYAQKPT